MRPVLWGVAAYGFHLISTPVLFWVLDVARPLTEPW